MGAGPLPGRGTLMHVFISYNQKDQTLASTLAVQLRFVGIDVFLDAWEIAPGDSIPGKVNGALRLSIPFLSSGRRMPPARSGSAQSWRPRWHSILMTALSGLFR